MIRIGVCASMSLATTIHAAGFDYFEGSVGEVLCPTESDDVFAARLRTLRSLPLPCEALNCMVPGSLKIVGPAVDRAKLEQYVTVMFGRAPQAGVRVIVFGSGGARAIPEGFDPTAAHEQLLWFMRLLGDKAAAAGVRVALEPLNRCETNVVNSTAEGADWVREAARPAFGLLVDAFHLMREAEAPAVIEREAALFAHMHVATCVSRFAPGLEPCSGLTGFYAAVLASGYNGRMSVEGSIGEFPAVTLPVVCRVLREALCR